MGKKKGGGNKGGGDPGGQQPPRQEQQPRQQQQPQQQQQEQGGGGQQPRPRGGGQQGPGRGGGQEGRGRGGGQPGQGRGGGQQGHGRGDGYQRGGQQRGGGQQGRGQSYQEQQPSPVGGPQQFRQQGQGDPRQQGTPPQTPHSQESSPSPVQSPQDKSRSPSIASTSSSSKDVQKITSGTTSMSLGISSEQWAQVKQLPLRANREKAPKVGRPITVETNHVALAMSNTSAKIIHYDVEIIPDKPFRFYRPAMEAFKRKHYPNRHPAFDGKKNLYSMSLLPFNEDLSDKVIIWDEERNSEKEIQIKVKIANSIDIGMIKEYLQRGTSLNPPQEAIQALDIVLRQPAAARFTQVRRSYFTAPSGQVFRLGGGLDLWYGFFQSAILGGRPFLNIDVAHKGFPADVNCIEAIENLMNEEQRSYGPGPPPQRIRLNPNDIIPNHIYEKFSGLVKGLKVVYKKPVRQSGQAENRTYKVHNVGESPRDKKFRKETGGLMTVEQYFKDEYKVRLSYPNAPCLIVGSLEKPLSLPSELCTIAKGQVINRQMDENQTRNMVQQAARPPWERKKRIEDSMRQLDINSHPCVKEFGLSIRTEFTKVEGRVLRAPRLQYQDGLVPAARGEWKSRKFINPQGLNNWAIYHSRVRDNDLRQLWEGFIRSGRDLGMVVSQPQIFEKRRLDVDFENFKKQKFQLVVVIIPDFDRTNEFTYAKVKQTAETRVGLLTQCLRNRTMRKLSPPTLINILLKVNAKLNGVNHNVERSVWPTFLARPVMVVGADVTHPAPTSDPSKMPTVPSVAAVAASHDPNAFKYNMLWRLQQPREEMIVELEDIMKEQLMFFYRSNNGQKPEAIYFYRDGVSEGQFAKVLQVEVQAIKRACKALSKGDPYEPPITFLVVQKRHHTRFFPMRPEDEEGKNRNVPAGTVVDTVITHPREMDFYLVSHASIQGTARPTKYHLLYEDQPLPEATLEEITFYLCHLFTRCTRSVSYPAPTYYAHLAAFRIRHYMERSNIRLDRLGDEQKSLGIKEFLTSDHPMFFV